MDNKKLFYWIVAIQIVFLLLMIGFKQSTLVFGEKILLKPEPVDPTDPLRGDYVNIRYDISTIELSADQRPDFIEGQKVYVGLKKGQQEYWEISGISQRPTGDPYIKGVIRNINQKISYTIQDENSSRTYAWESIDYAYGVPEWGEFKTGEKVEMTFSGDDLISVSSCKDECPSALYGKDFNERVTFRTGTVSSEVRGITEMILDYPIDTYFVPKGEGMRDELREFDKLLIEVFVWRGDAVVTSILYDGNPLEFSTP